MKFNDTANEVFEWSDDLKMKKQVWCSVLQCVAVRCSLWQPVAVWCSELWCVAVCMVMLRQDVNIELQGAKETVIAVCCDVLQCAAVCCSALHFNYFKGESTSVPGVKETVFAVCCNVLQCAFVCCSALQCVAARCSVLQRVAVQ